MISVDEAVQHILAHRPERTIESAPISKAARRTLAEDIRARVSKPPAAVSAMDGYAVRLDDVRQPNAALSVIGEAPAGAPFAETVSSGEAVRIFTGAQLPDGADHIVIQENVERSGNSIICKQGYSEIKHVRAKGLDFAEGDTVLAKGTRLSAFDVSLAAAANHNTLTVFRPLKVALLSNGDELKPPGSTLAQGEIVSANPAGLGAFLLEWGADAIDLGIATDNLDAIKQKIASAPADCDIFVPIGGASVGDHDHMRRAFLDAGFELIFEKVAVRPGKPTWFAKRGNQLVLGLPGNPASALVCANLFLRLLVYGSDAHRFTPATVSMPIAANGSREAFLRAVAELGSDTRLSVRTLPNQDSSLITPLSKSNCLIRRNPHHSETLRGEVVEIMLTQPISL